MKSISSPSHQPVNIKVCKGKKPKQKTNTKPTDKNSSKNRSRGGGGREYHKCFL